MTPAPLANIVNLQNIENLRNLNIGTVELVEQTLDSSKNSSKKRTVRPKKKRGFKVTPIKEKKLQLANNLPCDYLIKRFAE